MMRKMNLGTVQQFYKIPLKLTRHKHTCALVAEFQCETFGQLYKYVLFLYMTVLKTLTISKSLEDLVNIYFKLQFRP